MLMRADDVATLTHTLSPARTPIITSLTTAGNTIDLTVTVTDTEVAGLTLSPASA